MCIFHYFHYYYYYYYIFYLMKKYIYMLTGKTDSSTLVTMVTLELRDVLISNILLTG